MRLRPRFSNVPALWSSPRPNRYNLNLLPFREFLIPRFHNSYLLSSNCIMFLLLELELPVKCPPLNTHSLRGLWMILAFFAKLSVSQLISKSGPSSAWKKTLTMVNTSKTSSIPFQSRMAWISSLTTVISFPYQIGPASRISRMPLIHTLRTTSKSMMAEARARRRGPIQLLAKSPTLPIP